MVRNGILWRLPKKLGTYIGDLEKYPAPFPVGVPMFGKETWNAIGRRIFSASDAIKLRDYVTMEFKYKATGDDLIGWFSSTHMPQWASRITLTLSDMRVRKPCNVTEEEAESLMPDRWCPYNLGSCQYGYIPSGNTSLEPDECRCGDMTTTELFRTWFTSLKGDVNLYHFSALATPTKEGI
jgi:hypothetical protein